MSASMRPTRWPACASATARFTDTVDFPTPPLPDEIAITLPRCGSSTGRSEEHTSELQSRLHLVCRIIRSEEHTSELQSRLHLVCRLLLEKKKNHRLHLTTHHLNAVQEKVKYGRHAHLYYIP